MRNSIMICVVINICSLSLIAALYMFYKSIVSNQADIRRDIASIEALVRQEIVFDIVDNDDRKNGLDVENCCDFVTTSGMPIYMEKK